MMLAAIKQSHAHHYFSQRLMKVMMVATLNMLNYIAWVSLQLPYLLSGHGVYP